MDDTERMRVWIVEYIGVVGSRDGLAVVWAATAEEAISTIENQPALQGWDLQATAKPVTLSDNPEIIFNDDGDYS